MRFLKNRITISLVVIFGAAYAWEFYIRPSTGVLYTAAVSEYQNRNYDRSLELLRKAYRIDPNDSAMLRLLGWNYLKKGAYPEAVANFSRALRLNPKLDDARMGLAYCWLEMGETRKALEYFQQLPAADQRSPEIRTAMARAYRLLGDNQTALQLAMGVLRENKEDKLARKELAFLTGSEDPEAVEATRAESLPRPSSLIVPARARNESFEILQDGGWKRVYLAGVNLTPAVPGHFPSDPPNEVTVYLDWLSQIRAMGANCVRVYTLLPPAFYRALMAYNAEHAQSPVYLLQQVWLDDAPDGNLFNQAFTAHYEKAIYKVVDAVHGQANLPFEKGRGGGIYFADVSRFVVGWLVGRDIEPHVVVTTNLRNPGIQSYAGRYLTIENGNPTEVWLTRQCDAVVRYEVEKYNWQRPVAFVDWAPLDPLTHSTESRMVEEIVMRQKLGEKSLPLLSAPVDDDDAASLDPTKLKPTAAFSAGLFAAYSVYPYYPDFMDLDPHYLEGQDSQGPSSFVAYLEDLRRYHKDMPLLVAEFGIPSSLGISHFNPAGWNEGGHTEAQQGEYLARMIRSIFETGCAGGLVESWLDEWYRQNWLVRDFELPGGRTRLWLNTLSPEANQGLVGFRPSRGETHLLNGDAGRWQPSQLFYQKAPGAPVVRSFGDSYDAARHLLRLFVDSDEAYLYLRLDVERLDNDGDGTPDWKEANYLFTFGTTVEPTGSVLLPFVSNVRIPSGADYVLRLGEGDQSKILLASVYNPYKLVPVAGIPEQTQLRYRIPFLPSLAEEAQFDEMLVEPNRRRYGRDGHMYPPVRYSRSPLKWGTLEPGSPDYNTLAEWYASPKANMIELRIPWGLLQVADPSSLQVLAGIDRSGTFYTETTEGLQVAVVSYRPQTQELADVLPRFRPPGIIAAEDLKRFKWAPWESVTVATYLKDSYYVVQRALQELRSPRKAERARAAVPKGRKRP